MENPTLTQVLREAVEEAREESSLNAVALACDIPTPVLDRFMKGERDINLATAQKLCGHLGLRFTRIKRTRR